MSNGKELLRISMSEEQVKDACREFAQARSKVSEPCTVSVVLSARDPDDGVSAEVTFTRKRTRKAK